ncbi:hypothetical protein [Novosphingobium sp. ST904]|uniref:hypothetical protein n=1 Tax=Novosphingobium sp. ST904 TaxID=1684385 RepID=UPI0006C8CAC5|nr:hypothetical protein [Novosphingobium sp. ST904]TCM23030.1 hypothetical protein EDF59_1602 [Novosphingobium sp. ST904]
MSENVDSRTQAVAEYIAGMVGEPYGAWQHYTAEAGNILGRLDALSPAREEVSGEEVKRVARAIAGITAQRGIFGSDREKRIAEWVSLHWSYDRETARAAIAAMNPKPAEAASGAGEWQDIASAPKDGWGAPILTCRMGELLYSFGHQSVGGYAEPPEAAYWNEHGNCWTPCQRPHDGWDPTHWMPMLTPPALPDGVAQ